MWPFIMIFWSCSFDLGQKNHVFISAVDTNVPHFFSESYSIFPLTEFFSGKISDVTTKATFWLTDGLNHVVDFQQVSVHRAHRVPVALKSNISSIYFKLYRIVKKTTTTNDSMPLEWIVVANCKCLMEFHAKTFHQHYRKHVQTSHISTVAVRSNDVHLFKWSVVFKCRIPMSTIIGIDTK